MSTAVSFALPPANEATTTPERRGIARDDVRLLVTDRASGAQHDARFGDLASFLRSGDLLVANDSGTLPAALVARRADGTQLPLHLSTRIGGELWIVEPRGSAASGEQLALAAGASATLLARVDPENPRLWYAALAGTGTTEAFLARHGAPIHYRYLIEALPIDDYQTVFARVPGSAEMPSAGRPFTPRVLASLSRAGIGLATLTLHTGVSSPERDERPYREWFDVPAATAASVNAAHERGSRVVAIGTTVVRALESSAVNGEAIATRGWTDVIVTPKRGVELVDALLTGFHEPQASHLDLLRAFASDELLESAYEHAIAAGYLWHEFGDVHLLR